MGNSPNYDQIRKDKINQRDRQLQEYRVIFQSIVKKSNISQSLYEHVFRSDLVEIVKLLNKRQITSEQLVAIYGIRAVTIGKEFCIITQHNFQYALKKAKECDQYRKSSGKVNLTIEEDWSQSKHLPVLFGVPISIKDNVQMEGTASTIGLSSRAFKIDKKDSSVVVCIKNNGMIPFVKTNLPQLAFNFDSNNFLWGRCLNPWNKKKSAGGSSGGQAAALAAGVSPIGIGNDMGGSIRIPAHFCGVSGLMPSVHRIGQMGAFTKYSLAFSGKCTVTGVNGPIGRSIDSLALWMKAMTTQQYYQGKSDPYVNLIPFDMKTYNSAYNDKKKLRIGYFKHLQMIQSTPACARALQETIQFLKSEQHELIEISIPNERETICSLFAEMTSQGDFNAFTDMLEGQQLTEQYKNTASIAQMNCCLFGTVQCIMNCSQPRMGILVNASKKLTSYEYQKMRGRVSQLRQEWINYWRSNKLDFVVSPGFGMQAPNHGMSKDGSLLAAYTFIWNILAMPVATTPITVVKENQQKYQSIWDDDITKAIKKSVVDSEGLPISIQIIGIPFQEQKILGFAKKIENHFKFYQKHPLPMPK